MKTLIYLLVIFSLSSSLGHAAELISLGLYKLEGATPDGRKYNGKIIIEKEKTNYRVTWFIGKGDAFNQAQVGIGILTKGILSIGYMDASGMDFGVVSMTVKSNKALKGTWTSILSKGGFGHEEFKFISSKVPAELKPEPPKLRPADTI